MKSLLSKNKILFKYFIFIIILSFVSTCLEYMGVSYNLVHKINIFINLILVFIYSHNCTKNNSDKGYKIGFKSGLKILLILFILNIITFNNFSFKTLIYYLIILLVSISSSIISKNRQKNYSS